MLPLIAHRQSDENLFLHEGRGVSVSAFLAATTDLAGRMPDSRYVMNLCDDRLHFAIGMSAALSKSQTTLMPPNRAPEVIQELLNDYPNCQIIWDRPLEGLQDTAVPVTTVAAETLENSANAHAAIPEFDDQLEAVTAFTSGSTGKPKPNSKTWAALHTGTALAASRFFGSTGNRHIVATVPAQHMYGLETSVLYAMLAGCPTHSGRPFFPADVAAALETLPEPRVLVTTPAHLRAIIQADVTLPAIEFMISATAPLPLALAEQAEQKFNTEVREIYGCTEAGSLASRRQTASTDWLLYKDMSLTSTAQGLLLDGPQLNEAVLLQDRIELVGDKQFKLLGRNEDMLNIAGKRASLTDLSNTLLDISGVSDAVMVAPDDSADARVGRIAALVVAPGMTSDQILEELRPRIDPVFLPRPLIMVDKLPRNAASKLPRKAVLALLQQKVSEGPDSQS